MLGPSLNIQRTPLCGRNFEYFGEDPYLTSRIAVSYILGEQTQGVGHSPNVAANNQETQRNRIDVDIDNALCGRSTYRPSASVQEADVLTIIGVLRSLAANIAAKTIIC